MALPIVGGDHDTWGDKLNSHLTQMQGDIDVTADEAASAKVDAANAASTANTAISTANNASTRADQAVATANEAKQAASDLSIAALIDDPGSATGTSVRAAVDAKVDPIVPRTQGRAVGQGELTVNVRDAQFGALGDGVTNDTAALQAAIDYVANNGGGEVYIPEGTYRTSGLIHRSKVTMRGQGRGVTILRSVIGSLDDAVLTLDVGPVQHADIVDLSILGSGVSGQHGIHFKAVGSGGTPDHGGWWNSELRRVNVQDFDGHAIWLEGGGTDSLKPHQFLTLHNVLALTTDQSWNALLLTGQVGQVEVIGGTFDGPGLNTGGTNVRILRQIAQDGTPASDTAPYAIHFIGTTFQGNDRGVYIERASSVAFNGPYCENLGVSIHANASAGPIYVNGIRASNAGANAAGTGAVVRAGSNSIVRVNGGTVIGSVDKHWEADSGTAATMDVTNVYISSAEPVTSGITKQVSVSVDGTLNIELVRTMLVNSSTTAITTIASRLSPGEMVYLRAHGGSITLASGGNIDIGGRTSPVTVPQYGVVALVRFDLGGQWQIVSVSA